MDNICGGNRTTSCPVGRPLREGLCPLESSQALPGRRQREGSSRRGFLADGSKQLEEPLLILQAKTSHVLEAGRERAFERAGFSHLWSDCSGAREL